ncbi:MAG TPA: 23S rRNA (guanosine(2251)-2'-O)-methyltransferase RlmB [Chlamydiales bacterium]|nr:23S rRNA (guanosine(2251)-2'-O)-methyltransferase RlmB [Chlamydiales bacterium]
MKNKNSSTRWIMGQNCIKEVLDYAPDRILEIYVDSKVKSDSFMKSHPEIPVQLVAKKTLDQWVNSESHQGVVAKVKNRHLYSLKEFIQKEERKDRSLIVMLDSIEDPQNFGTILRACECFGVSGVIFSKNRGVAITPVVTKTSVGASELLSLVLVSNLAQSVDLLQRNGYEVVVADVNAKAVAATDMKFSDKTVLVMGAEKQGVQKLIQKMADGFVYIPMKGRIDSLNVSQATAVLLSKWS